MAATNVKIQTFSFDLPTIEKLNKLQDFLHLPNKSKILSNLVDREYRAQIKLKEDAEPN